VETLKSLREIEKKSFLSLEDLVKLEEFILETGYMSREKALEEIERFAVNLGIDEYYFKSTGIDDIAKHLISISASELVSKYGGVGVGVELINEEEDRALYIIETTKIEEIEDRIEKKYPTFRVESYRTKNPSDDQHLRLYIVSKPLFKEGLEKKKELSFQDAANEVFLEARAAETLSRYQEAWEWMCNREAPFISITEKPESDETRVMVGIHGQETRQFMANFTNQVRRFGLMSNRKYKETFFDQKSIYTFYFEALDKEIVEDFSRGLNTTVMLPQDAITKLFTEGIFGAQPTMYAISAAAFTNQFITVLTEEYTSLSKALKDQPEAKGILDKMKLRLVKDTFTEARIAQTVKDYSEIVSLIYQDFSYRLHPKRSPTCDRELHKKIENQIETDVPSITDKIILHYFLMFNKMILKTNFFRRDKICAVYRLDPSFLDEVDFPEKPFSVFFCVGRAFIGFHIRFRDIARGGIRIVKSRNISEYHTNLDTVFMENYNLALTQQKKNKDIPEGGSKGIILLRMDNQEEVERAFIDYVDGILDVIIDHEEVTDLFGKEEILFFGPDERTADLMDWVPFYARKRMYPFWKALSTGKAPENGGIPHDLYGMTTSSVHQYVLGALEKRGLKEENVSKVQTGGPDGDLGSNEIKISKDKTIAVVDGSGVLYDPQGINRNELGRLAAERVMVENFDRSMLSSEGFLVTVNDKQVTLPDGTLVPNGEEFRNGFHLHPLAKADLFVPCGGRPAAVNINNWRQLIGDGGAPKFKIIVEGANLFITEEARLRLEEHGVVVIKDASANKGGVTSSSLEVFASLALSDDEFDAHMRVKNGNVPEFMKLYVDEVIATINNNARTEFELLWSENDKKGLPFTHLTNIVSRKINDITDAIFNSDLPSDIGLKEKVVQEYTPKPLLDLVGLEKILKRVPDNYLNAIVATKLATSFVYAHGLDGNEIDFFNYLKNYTSA
jgi:glutamate dehydrogenase